MKKLLGFILVLALVLPCFQVFAANTTIEYSTDINYMSYMLSAANEGTEESLAFGAKCEELRNRKIDEVGSDYAKTDFFTSYTDANEIKNAIYSYIASPVFSGGTSMDSDVSVIVNSSNGDEMEAYDPGLDYMKLILNVLSSNASDAMSKGKYYENMRNRKITETGSTMPTTSYFTTYSSLEEIKKAFEDYNSSNSSRPSSAANAKKYEVDASLLNCRSDASINASVIARYKRGTLLTSLGENKNGFAKVQNGSTVGWCSLDYLKAATGSSSVSYNGFEVTASLLNCRKDASYSSSIVARFQRGTSLLYLDESKDGFAKVQCGSIIGWCALAYLKETSVDEESLKKTEVEESDGDSSTEYPSVAPMSYTDEDLEWLALAIYREAGSSWLSDLHQLLVANVVINRVNSDYYPDSIKSVLTQYGQYPWASNPYSNGSPTERCYTNAKRILNGERFCPSNVLYQSSVTQGNGTFLSIHDSNSGETTYFCYR